MTEQLVAFAAPDGKSLEEVGAYLTLDLSVIDKEHALDTAIRPAWFAVYSQLKNLTGERGVVKLKIVASVQS